jgi:hypothetical protein
MPRNKIHQWFSPAKVLNSGFGIYSWQGYLATAITIILVIVDVAFLFRYLFLVILVAVILLTGFLVVAIKHGAKFSNNNLR